MLPKEVAMEVAIHLPDDIAAAVPWDDVSHHLVLRFTISAMVIRADTQ